MRRRASRSVAGGGNGSARVVAARPRRLSFARRAVTTRPTAASAAAARHASFVVWFDSSLRLPQGSILHHVRKRYKSNLIYTLVGSILVAVNPFQRLDIYTEVRSFARNGSR